MVPIVTLEGELLLGGDLSPAWWTMLLGVCVCVGGCLYL